MPLPVGDICRKFNTVVQILILMTTSIVLFSSPFCLVYYVSFSYKLDFLGMLVSPVTLVLVALIYNVSLLVYTACLFFSRTRAPELESDAYMNKRSKSDLERQHLLANEHPLGDVEVDDRYTRTAKTHLGPLQSFFMRYIKTHNITALVLFLLSWVFALAIACYYYAPFNPIKIKSIKPYQTLAYSNASESIQITWNKDKSRDNKLLVFKENWMPTRDDMVNPSLWDEIVPSVNSNQRYAVFTNLTPGRCYYYYVPSFTTSDELNSMCLLPTDAQPTIAIIADMDSSPYINRLLNERLHSLNPNLTVLLGNMVKFGTQESEWLLFMQSQGVFNYFRKNPAVALPGFKESKGSAFFSNRPRYFYSLVFSDSQVLSRHNNNSNSSSSSNSKARYSTEVAKSTQPILHRRTHSYTPKTVSSKPQPYYTDDDMKYIPEHLREYYHDEQVILEQQETVGEYKYYITGDMVIILLDSMQETKRAHKYKVRLGSFLTVEQVNWLVSILETDAVKRVSHVVLFVQAPLYSTAEFSGVTLLAELLEPIICTYRISAVFAADSRIYELYHDSNTCSTYGVNHTFLHVTVGSGGSPPASMLSLFLGKRRWDALSYSANSSGEDPEPANGLRTRVYARSGFTYATLALTTDHALVVTAYDIITGKEVSNFQLSVQKR